MSGQRLISSLLLCFYLVAVAFLCFGKPEDMPQVAELWFGLPSDKVGHFLMFSPFPPLVYQTIIPRKTTLTSNALILIMIIAIGAGMAIGTEYVQALTAYREADIKDFYADAAGLLFGGLCTAALIIYRKVK